MEKSNTFKRITYVLHLDKVWELKIGKKKNSPK